MSDKYIERLYTTEGRQLHTCCVCKKTDVWNDDNWRWFGSYKDYDNGKPILKFCSDECAKHRSKRSKELAKAMAESEAA